MRSVLVAALLAGTASAQEGPVLGAATNFEQGDFPEKMANSLLLPVKDFRDAMRWREVEQDDGTYVFDNPRTIYPRRLAEIGAVMSLTIDGTHAKYDGGNTPVTPEGRAAFARFAARVVQEFPNVHSLEVGNEFNSSSFTKGPGWEGDIRERARNYAALMQATALEVRAARPEVKILGGAAHSIPIPWFEEIFAAGGGAYMDAMVLHPYTTPPEILRRQIALLRRIPGAETMPIEITEWGTTDVAGAPSYLLKGYCQFALSGVTRFIWYPLGDRGDGLAPLLEGDALSAAGWAYRLAYENFQGKKVHDLGVDPFTYGCGFGDRSMVLWGAPRDVFVADGVRALAPDGSALPPEGLRLDRDRPVVLLADRPIALGMDVTLGPQAVIADSYDQFSYPDDPSAGPFTYYSTLSTRLEPYETRPGQERDGVPWSPYLASPMSWQLRADAEWVIPRRLPGGIDTIPASVVLRYHADRGGPALLRIEIAPGADSTDGVILTVRAQGEPLFERTVTAAEVLEQPVTLVEGGDIDVLIAPGESDDGDFTRLRVRLTGAD